tara:strand:+ start:177 stop:581 length:405 start_codon:yes stop_codon:yes gene_type:complete
MSKTFHLDIITPTSIKSLDDVSYIRIPSIDGLVGIQARHTNAIIGLDIGEIKITANGEDVYFATSGGFADIKNESVQLLIETVESIDDINHTRAQDSFERGQKRLKSNDTDIKRAELSVRRAKNRLTIYKKYHR